NQKLGVGYKIAVTVTPSSGGTPYFSADTGLTFSITQPVNKTQALSQVGPSVLTPAPINVQTVLDHETGLPIVQAAVTVNSNDANNGTRAPIVGVLSPSAGTAAELASEATLRQLFNGLDEN